MKLLALLAVAGSLSAQTEKMVAQISPDRIGASVRTLAGFRTRGNYSVHNAEARKWILEQFKSYSPRLQVSDEGNVVAVLPGDAEPAKRIIVGAHYDSINLKDKKLEAPAPGADDDASGTAVVLELARVMSLNRFRKTIVFIAFGGEEIGLVGSTRYATRAKAAKEQIEAVFNNDIVGSNVLGRTHSDIDGSDDDTVDAVGDTGNLLRVYSPDPPDSPSRRLARLTQESAKKYVPGMRIDLASRADRFGRGGDQVPFQENGFAAVRLTSASENTAIQHTAEDTPDGVSSAFTADVARVNCAAIATLALGR